jgi:hypothetical protein
MADHGRFNRGTNLMTDTNQKKLGSTLWGIADQLRGR